MKQLTKGIKIIARDCEDKPLIRVLWEIGGQCAYVCSLDQFNKLIRGDMSSPAIGFPIEDVYRYDESIEQKLRNESFDWSSVERLEGA